MSNLISAVQGSELGRLGLQLMKKRNSLPDYDISGLAVNFRRDKKDIKICVSMNEEVIKPNDPLYARIDEELEILK